VAANGHKVEELFRAFNFSCWTGKMQVSYGDQQACLPVIFTARNSPAITGRNQWLSVVITDFPGTVQQSRNLISKYASLCDGNLGSINGVIAQLKP